MHIHNCFSQLKESPVSFYLPVSLLHFFYKLIGGKLSPNHQNELLDNVFSAVNVQ